MKERKIIFAYVEMERSSYKYRYVKAISEGESKKFHFAVDWDNYEQSETEMLSAFERFCVKECEFYDSAYCDIWFTSCLFLTATAFSDTQQRRKTKCKLWKFVKLG